MSEAESSDAESSEEEPSKPILIVDPDPASRNAGEDLEDDLNCRVVAIDSIDFDLEGSEEIGEADAFIVCWDLGFRSGVDVVELIRADETLGDRVVIVAAAAPTRSLVRCAFESGADGVCQVPYDAAEIQERLAAGRARRAALEAA